MKDNKNNSDELAREAFSAWLDDENNELDTQRLVTGLEQGSLNLDQLDGLALVRQHSTGQSSTNLLDKIHKQLDEEQVAIKSKVGNTGNRKLIYSLVASFVLVVVAISPITQNDGWLGQRLIAQQVSQIALVEETQLMSHSQNRLNQYLQSHLRVASLGSGKISLPYKQPVQTDS